MQRPAAGAGRAAAARAAEGAGLPRRQPRGADIIIKYYILLLLYIIYSSVFYHAEGAGLPRRQPRGADIIVIQYHCFDHDYNVMLLVFTVTKTPV